MTTEITENMTAIEKAEYDIQIARNALTDLYGKRNGIERDLKALGIKMKYDADNEELKAEKEALTNTLVGIEMQIEDAQADVNDAEAAKQQAIHARVDKELHEIAEAIQIDLGINTDENPIMAARLISAMAGSLQYTLESGKPFFIRLTQRVYSRQFGEDQGGSLTDNPGEFSYDAEMQLQRLEDERRMMGAYLHALKREYDKCYALRDPNQAWFPPFLNRTNSQVAQQVAEREEKRYQKFVDEQKVLRETVARHTQTVDVLPTFS